MINLFQRIKLLKHRSLNQIAEYCGFENSEELSRGRIAMRVLRGLERQQLLSLLVAYLVACIFLLIRYPIHIILLWAILNALVYVA